MPRNNAVTVVHSEAIISDFHLVNFLSFVTGSSCHDMLVLLSFSDLSPEFVFLWRELYMLETNWRNSAKMNEAHINCPIRNSVIIPTQLGPCLLDKANPDNFTAILFLRSSKPRSIAADEHRQIVIDFNFCPRPINTQPYHIPPILLCLQRLKQLAYPVGLRS